MYTIVCLTLKTNIFHSNFRLICGRRIKVELSTGKSRREDQMPPTSKFPPRNGGGSGGGPPPRFNNRDRSPIGRNGPPRREYHGHSNYHDNQRFDSREHYNNSRYPRKHRSWYKN